MANEDAELIALCKKGDIKSYESLYSRYSRAMYHTCMRIVRNAGDAEDILQEAFLTAFTSLEKLSREEAFGGWLKRIVIHKSVNHISRDRKKWQPLDEIDHDVQEPEHGLDELEFQTRINVVKEALDALPDKYRVVIFLHVFEKMTFEDIAGMMKVPSSTIRSRYLRGRQKVLEQVRAKKM